MTDQNAKVSVIVTTRNSAKTLLACLESIKGQEYEPIELILADNGSTDTTTEIAAEFADTVINFGPERSAQRNRGAEISTGEFLVFIDHDMRLDWDVVGACVTAARENDCLIIPEYSFGIGFFAKARALERSCYVGDADIEAARFFRRDIFEKLGGYDPELIAGGEDWDLHARALKSGYRIGRADAWIGHDEGRVTIKDSIRKRLYYGASFALYRQKNPERAKRQFSPFRRAYARNWKHLLRHPLLTFGFTFLKSAEFAAGVIGARRRPA